MSLEQFRRARMVILTRRAMAYQAARAMADHHIGAVLVSEPPGLVGIVTDRDLALAVLGSGFNPDTPLGEVMSEVVIACDIAADLDQVVRLMIDHGIRRVPVTEQGRPVGLVTFDDLVANGGVGLDDLRAIVAAQLEVESPQKPAGTLHPKSPASAEARTRALMRARARTEATYNRMIKAVADAAGQDRGRSEQALFVATCLLCRRLTPDEAQHLIAQLPAKLQPRLEKCLDGPDRAVTGETIKSELGRALGLGVEDAEATMAAVFQVLAGNVTAGQIAEVRGQLPKEMKGLFPATLQERD